MATEALFEKSGAARIVRFIAHSRFERRRVWGRVAKVLSAVAAPLLLAGCFLTPGAFDSSLDLRRDGTFSFAYKGEIVFALPDDMMKYRETAEFEPICYGQSDTKEKETLEKIAKNAVPNARVAVDLPTADNRPCTPTEVAEKKKQWDQSNVDSAKRKADESKQFAAMFGYAPGDDEANRRLAAQLAKYDGFRSVSYTGGGVFTVDYAKTGRLDHDLVFPVMLQGNVMFPFVLARPQTDGSVRVSAPAFVGNGALGALSRMKDMGMGSADMAKMPANRTKGRFVLTTDGEVLTNNTDEGPVKGPRGKVLSWTVDQRSTVAPEALVKLR